MNFTKKSELNNRRLQLTSGNFSRKAEQNYLQSTSNLNGKNAENLWSSDSGQKGVILMNQEFKRLFVCVFFFVYFVSNLAQEDLYFA